jgi:hypothetical protein
MSRQRQIDQGHPRTALLDTNGDGTGSIDLRVNGAVTPVDFKIEVPQGSTYYMFSINVYVKGSPVSASGWAGGGALTNGLDFGILKDGVFTSVIPQKSIQSNGDFAVVGATINILVGAAADSYTAHLNLKEKYGAARKLLAGEAYAVRVRDDLTLAGDGTFAHVGYVEVKENTLS